MSSAEFPLREFISYPTIFITFDVILYLLVRYNHLKWFLSIIASILAGQILLHMLETHSQLDLNNITDHYMLLIIWSVSAFLDTILLITFWKMFNLAPLCSPIRVVKHILVVVGLLISTFHTSIAVIGLITAVYSIIRRIFQGEPNTRTT